MSDFGLSQLPDPHSCCKTSCIRNSEGFSESVVAYTLPLVGSAMASCVKDDKKSVPT